MTDQFAGLWAWAEAHAAADLVQAKEVLALLDRLAAARGAVETLDAAYAKLYDRFVRVVRRNAELERLLATQPAPVA